MFPVTTRVDFNTSCSYAHQLHITLHSVGFVEDSFLEQLPHEFSTVPLPNRPHLNARFILGGTPLLSDWSDVQQYRQPVGLLCVNLVTSSAKAAEKDLVSIKDSYEKLKKRSEVSVIDSRCVVFTTTPLNLPPDCIKPDIMVIECGLEPSSVHCEELTALLGEFTQALFSIVARKTIEMAAEKYCPQILYSPYERSRSGLEDGKTGRRRVQGRHKKHLGDLFLLVGNAEKAHEAYDESLKILLSIGDSVWVGAAYEGQCCAIARMLQVEGAGPAGGISGHGGTGSQDSLNSLNSEPEQRSLENITRTFRSAVTSMERIRESALIMLESTLKFIRLMIDLDCYTEACNILNAEIFYCLEDLLPIERLQFFCTIALLYQRMGMERKYCYFLRRVALESMTMDPKLKPHLISFAILREVLEKYGVVPGDEHLAVGWPHLQRVVLENFITASDKLANGSTVVEYGMCLLQNFHSHLDYDDQLRTLNLILKNSTWHAERRITVKRIPLCKRVTINALSETLQPRLAEVSSSVFIYNPKAKEKQVVCWVAQEFGTVVVRLENPLLHSLQLLDMRCVVEGGEVECYPGTVTIYPKQVVDVALTMKPLQACTLRVTAISAQLWGIPCQLPLDSAEELIVAPVMPLLSISAPTSLSLFEGEEVCCRVGLTNNSDHSITELELVDGNGPSSSSIFRYEPLSLPIEPGVTVEMEVKVETRVGYVRREECFGVEEVRRGGTEYENSSGGVGEGRVVRRSRRAGGGVEPVILEETFGLAIRYFEAGGQYYREGRISIPTQISLLYRLHHYAIAPHPADSALCRWTLSLSSLCPERIELEVAGERHILEPGERLTTDRDLPRVAPASGAEITCHRRVRHSDLLLPECLTASWSAVGRSGRVALMCSVPSATDLHHAFAERLVISCSSPGGEHPVGTPIPLTVSLRNVSTGDISSVFLFVRAFCVGTTRKVAAVPRIGSPQLAIPLLRPGQTVTHSFSYLPLTSGEFAVEIGACLLPEDQQGLNTVLKGEDLNKDEEDCSPFLATKVVVKFLTEGLPPPKFITAWTMRPRLNFSVVRT